jgi:IS5 family transposase
MDNLRMDRTPNEAQCLKIMGTAVILMPSFECYILNEYYKKYLKDNDRLAKVASLIDWEAFRPIIASSYQNLTERGGRPNIDCTVMLKLLVLQQWYGLSDPELEHQVARDVIFQHLLGFPGVIPDYTTYGSSASA